MSEYGIEAVEASTAREAIRDIQQSSTFEFIFVVDRVNDLSLSETVQRLTAYPATSAIPLAVLTPNVTETELMVLNETPRIIYGTLTTRDNYMASVLRRMNSSADIPLPSRSDRLVWTGMLKASQAE